MAAHIDIAYIVKRLKDFKRGIIDLDNLADGIFIDMDIKKDSLKKSQVKDHLEGLETSFALGNIKDSDIPALAREIYYMNFLPKSESRMKLSLKERKLVREYAKKLIGKRLNESDESEADEDQDYSNLELSNGDITVQLYKAGSKWREGSVIDGEEPYGWGSKTYGSYLTPDDICTWLRKDYGGHWKLVNAE